MPSDIIKPLPIKPIAVSKIDDNTIQVIKQAPQPEPVTVNYDYDFLLSQRDAIQKDLDDYTAARQAELDEVNDLISQADALKVVSKTDVSDVRN